MSLDVERVQEKLAFIAQQAADLRRLAQEVTRERFTADGWLVRGAKYALQTAIEAMLDVLYHLAVKAASYAPADGRDALNHLTGRGVFTEEEAVVFQEMIGFRNRLVHGYELRTRSAGRGSRTRSPEYCTACFTGE